MNKSTTIMDNIEEQRIKLEKLKQEFLESNQKLFKEIVKGFFLQNPTVKLVAWDQYTPYFNDGETCTFSVNEIFFSTTERNLQDITHIYQIEDDHIIPVSYYNQSYEDTLEEYVDQPDSWSKSKHGALLEVGKNTYDNCNAFKLFIEKNSDLMLATFGDHSNVFLTPEEIVVEECSHE